MKKLLTTALLALTAALTAGAQSRTEVYTFPSEVLGAEKSCTVYLPDGYDRSQESYPVLYLLHGASGCHTDWTQKGDLRRIADEAIAAGMARPMIVVMPDASGESPKRTGKHMGYFDVPGWDYERFFFEVDYAGGCAYLGEDELHLTPIEYKLLCLLSKNVGKVLTHTFITQNIWGRSWDNDVASLRVFMATLRKKLEPTEESPQYIQTHIGVGYRMIKVE